MEEDLLAVHQGDPRRRVEAFRQTDARIAATDHHYVAVAHARLLCRGQGRTSGAAESPRPLELATSVALEF